ncbi:hypothetical protein HY933_02995 [Candidatus Falkowbacteria bacterium]|nr:hypothetical protein [Candidatus Falkowbacteria bacterium]
MSHTVTTNEILEAINELSTQMDQRFLGVDGRLDGVDGRLDGIDNRLDGVDGRLDGIDNRLDGMDQRFGRIEATMVTKDYLDRKMAQQKGELIVLMRKADKKVKAIVDRLTMKHIYSAKEKAAFYSMEPFQEQP